MQAPAITATPTNTHLPGKLVWHELLTDDAAAAERFYHALFGWTFKPVNPHYTLVLNAGTAIAGIVQLKKKTPEQPSRWLAALSVSDVKQTVKAAEAGGGTLHEGPTCLTVRGRYALISDPDGAELILLNSASGDPKDSTPPAGAWIWDELWSRNVQKSLYFYQQLAGYNYTPVGSDYVIAEKRRIWRAGIRPALIDNINGRWIPVLRTDYPEATARHAEQSGGQILVETQQADSDKKIIVVADPSGALFMLQSWPESSLPQQE